MSTITKSETRINSFISRTFLWMFAALMVSALFSIWFGTSPELMSYLMSTATDGEKSLTATGWVVMLAPLGFVLLMSFGYDSLSSSVLAFLFFAYAAINGISLSFIITYYTTSSLIGCFLTTAGMFSATAMYGYTTKKDLTSWGSMLFMAIFGIIIALIINMILHSQMMDFLISIAGVVVFTLLTAYDVQMIKNHYYDGKKGAIFAALQLYLDFINMFLYILRLFGNKD